MNKNTAIWKHCLRCCTILLYMLKASHGHLTAYWDCHSHLPVTLRRPGIAFLQSSSGRCGSSWLCTGPIISNTPLYSACCKSWTLSTWRQCCGSHQTIPSTSTESCSMHFVGLVQWKRCMTTSAQGVCVCVCVCVCAACVCVRDSDLNFHFTVTRMLALAASHGWYSLPSSVK